MDNLPPIALHIGGHTAIQLIALILVFVGFGFALSKIQFFTRKAYKKSIGGNALVLTGIIGTPIHELSHIITCKLFGHTIERFKLFRFKSSGKLGFVEHSYNPKNPWNGLGNFFIGSAPMLIGPLVIAALLYYLVPNQIRVFQFLTNPVTVWTDIYNNLYGAIYYLFSGRNLFLPTFWIFIYLAVSISLHLAPSKADRRGILRGLPWLFVLLILVNTLTWYLSFDSIAYFLSIQSYLYIYLSLILFALALSILHFIAASIFLFPFKKRK